MGLEGVEPPSAALEAASLPLAYRPVNHLETVYF